MNRQRYRVVIAVLADRIADIEGENAQLRACLDTMDRKSKEDAFLNQKTEIENQELKTKVQKLEADLAIANERGITLMSEYNKLREEKLELLKQHGECIKTIEEKDALIEELQDYKHKHEQGEL